MDTAPGGVNHEVCARGSDTAHQRVRRVHDRMPVILAPEDYGTWLDPKTVPEQLHALLRPYPAEAMVAVPVGSYVSNPRNEGPQCLAS
jgi:putative SOS response-associated peptidase YedK